MQSAKIQNVVEMTKGGKEKKSVTSEKRKVKSEKIFNYLLRLYFVIFYIIILIIE